MTIKTTSPLKSLFLFCTICLVALPTLLVAQNRQADAPIKGLQGISITLDPGHSRNENMGIHNLSESHKVLKTAQFMYDYFMTMTDVDTVILTRNDNNVSVSLGARSTIANNAGADMFHSLHSDAGPPARNTTLFLYGSILNGSEKSPQGGKDLGDKMTVTLTDAMRTRTSGNIGDRQFYGGTNNAPYLSVNRQTNMASILSEAGFHTNPEQNVLNMNDDFVRIQAMSYFLAFLDHYGIDRNNFEVFNGIVTDFDKEQPLNGATVTAGDNSYTTDTFESTFSNFIGGNLSEGIAKTLGNGYYFFQNMGTEALQIKATKEGYTSDSVIVEASPNFFAFKDFTLIENRPANVELIRFERSENNLNVDLDDELTVVFSKKMNRDRAEAAFGIEPAALLQFNWSNDRILRLTIDQLAFETSYTITIDSSATDMLELFGFDGNADGTAGDEFTFNFSTRTTDLAAPAILSQSPILNEDNRLESLNPVISFGYDEPVTQGLSGSTFDFGEIGGADVPLDIRKYDIDSRSILNFFPKQQLQPNTSYRLVTKAGIGDKYGNVTTEPSNFDFRTVGMNSSPVSIDNFENGITNWWTPGQSGSTDGTIATETAVAEETQITNRLFGTAKSMRLNYAWSEGANAYLIRQYLGGGAPRSVQIPSDSRVETYLFGDGSGTLFRFVILDGSGQLEASEWTRVDWYGWRHVYWDLANDTVVPWVNGNGTVTGNSIFDSFQLTTDSESVEKKGTIYFDDLRYDKVVFTSVDEDAAFSELPSETELMNNYPNPFNPTTNFRFRLAETGFTKLTIYDLTGRKIATVVQQLLSSGSHQFTWDASSLSSGAYVYRLEHNNQLIDTKLMTLIK